VINSFKEKIISFSLKDLGFVQQVDLFNMVSDKLGEAPPVIDADDLCSNPRAALIGLCTSLEINFHEEMLSWDTGPHPYDGIWGKYWYKSVNKSSRFNYISSSNKRSFNYQSHLIDEAEPYFQALNAYKITLP
jgi:hypothetical protein